MYLSLGAARLDQDGEVSDLVRDLVQQDGEGGDGAHSWTHQEGGADRQTVGEVVREVGRQVQVTRHLDVCMRGEVSETHQQGAELVCEIKTSSLFTCALCLLFLLGFASFLLFLLVFLLLLSIAVFFLGCTRETEKKQNKTLESNQIYKFSEKLNDLCFV